MSPFPPLFRPPPFSCPNEDRSAAIPTRSRGRILTTSHAQGSGPPQRHKGRAGISHRYSQTRDRFRTNRYREQCNCRAARLAHADDGFVNAADGAGVDKPRPAAHVVEFDRKAHAEAVESGVVRKPLELDELDTTRHTNGPKALRHDDDSVVGRRDIELPPPNAQAGKRLVPLRRGARRRRHTSGPADGSGHENRAGVPAARQARRGQPPSTGRPRNAKLSLSGMSTSRTGIGSYFSSGKGRKGREEKGTSLIYRLRADVSPCTHAPDMVPNAGTEELNSRRAPGPTLTALTCNRIVA